MKVEKPCNFETGKVVEEWMTGDIECDASSERYECGGIYNHNYMDRVGFRDHDCFWDCRDCKNKENKG